MQPVACQIDIACYTCYNSRFDHPVFVTCDICSHLEVQNEGSIDIH